MYINTETNEYPLWESDIRALYSNTSFTTNFVPPEVFQLVADGKVPEFDYRTESIRELKPILIDGIWTKQWEIVPLEIK